MCRIRERVTSMPVRRLLFLLTVLVITACAATTYPPLLWLPAESISQLDLGMLPTKLPEVCDSSVVVSKLVPDRNVLVIGGEELKPPLKILFNPYRTLVSIQNLLKSIAERRSECKSIFLVEQLDVIDYSLYASGWGYWSPGFSITISISKQVDEQGTKLAKYQIDILAPDFLLNTTYDTLTQEKMARAANTAVYYGVVYGVLDLASCIECTSEKIVHYEKLRNGGWVRVKRLTQDRSSG